MIRKTLIAIFAIITTLCFAIPAAAETFTSAAGIISIELPNEDWEQVGDTTKWIALSDGENTITIDHMSNGEMLPDMSVVDDQFVNVFQTVFSSQNEVFIVTGSSVDMSKTSGIMTSVMSFKILKYDTKLAVEKEDESASDGISIVPMDQTMYVTTDSLNVRSGCSVDAPVIGGLGYGDAVQVIGAAQKDGVDLGWYQVAYGDGTGFVYAGYLSDTAPAPETVSIIVYDEYGEAYTLYEGSDGYWRDSSGTEYVQLSDTEFQVRDGNKHLSA